jgi:hypothetical protein
VTAVGRRRSASGPVRAGHGDAGSGVVGTLGGFTAFLAFLLFAVQLLTNLYATSVVTSATYDGARQVAEADDATDTGARAAAERHVRALLGNYGDDAHFDWSGTTAEVVRLRVQIDNPSFLLRSLPADLPLQHVDRTAVVRVERPQ